MMFDDEQFLAAQGWRPIDGYDKGAGERVLLRAGNAWALGFWGEGPSAYDNGDPVYSDDRRMTWRQSQESIDDQPLKFEPAEFAEITDEQAEALFWD